MGTPEVEEMSTTISRGTVAELALSGKVKPEYRKSEVVSVPACLKLTEDTQSRTFPSSFLNEKE